MEKIKIITDSCSDLTKEIIEKFDIEVLPIFFMSGDNIYKDDPLNPPMTIKTFYDLMREGKIYKTSQLSSSDSRNTIEKYIQNGYKVLYLSFSSALSGSYNTIRNIKAELDAKYPKSELYVLDTALACVGQGFYVYQVANKLANNKDIKFEDLVSFAEKLKSRVYCLFTIDDIKVLQRGGRLTATKALIAKLLNLKPCLRIDVLGRLIPFKAARGTKNAIALLLETLYEQYDQWNVAPLNEIWIGNADNIEGALLIKQKLELKFKDKCPNIFITNVGPVIGAHVGPGMLSIFFVGQEENE